MTEKVVVFARAFAKGVAEIAPKLRKIRKKRGYRTVGYGRVGKHRGVGQIGGHGKAGRRKHLSSYVLRCEPDYFEKKGFKPPRRPEANIINVGNVDEKVNRPLDEEAVEKVDGIHIDLERLGSTNSSAAVRLLIHLS